MVLPDVEKTKFTKDFPKLRVCVTGAGGFIASHLARRLKAGAIEHFCGMHAELPLACRPTC